MPAGGCRPLGQRCRWRRRGRRRWSSGPSGRASRMACIGVQSNALRALLGLVAAVDGADVGEAAAVLEAPEDPAVGDGALDVLAGAGGGVEDGAGDIEPAVGAGSTPRWPPTAPGRGISRVPGARRPAARRCLSSTQVCSVARESRTSPAWPSGTGQVASRASIMRLGAGVDLGLVPRVGGGVVEVCGSSGTRRAWRASRACRPTGRWRPRSSGPR